MKLATVEIDGRETFGAVLDDGFMELGTPECSTLKAFIARGKHEQPLSASEPKYPIADLVWRPPITAPSRIVCVGVNYDLHRLEMGRDVPEHPVLFVRFPSSFVGHHRALLKPSVSDRFDYEGELAVVMGRRVRRIDRSEAYTAIAGYTCLLDGSVRDWQRHTSQFTPGKNFDASGAFGPWLVTRDEIDDPHRLLLRTRVNGEVLQEASTGQMTFQIPQLVAYISTFTTLEPGDIIATGTPGGVGDKRSPPRYLADGDRVEVDIEKIGTLSNPVTSELR